MKVRITNMKAPWPKGSGVGAVVSIDGDVLPGWAGGKCTRIEDGAKADFAYEPPELVGDGTGAALPSIDAVNAEIADLQAKLTAADAAVAKAKDEAKAEKARADDLQAKLTAAEKKAAKA